MSGTWMRLRGIKQEPDKEDRFNLVLSQLCSCIHENGPSKSALIPFEVRWWPSWGVCLLKKMPPSLILATLGIKLQNINPWNEVTPIIEPGNVYLNS